MEPISSLLLGHAAGKVLDKFGSSFRARVIDRWSRRRAEQFIVQFCEEVARQRDEAAPDALDELLTKIVEDEVCSELLFDAYRRVALSKSRTLGPRIIALLTAELVAERRGADDFEDTILFVAENLSDDELVAFARFVREEQMKASADGEKRGQDQELRVKWCDEQLGSGWSNKEGVSTGPLDLDECLGRWASKLKSYGIIKEDVKEREFEHKARYMEEPATVREISWWISIPAEYLKLVELIIRAGGDVDTRA